jgi:hypothetical protein
MSKYKVPAELVTVIQSLGVGDMVDGRPLFPGICDEPVKAELRFRDEDQHQMRLSYFGIKLCTRTYVAKE